ncbi:unnamed protein product [Caenorhabditis nigoni]
MAKSEQVSLQELLIAISIKILSTIFSFCFIVSAVYVGIKISGEAAPAPAQVVIRKAAPKKSKTPKTGGTGAMNSEPSKTEEEDPGLGA